MAQDYRLFKSRSSVLDFDGGKFFMYLTGSRFYLYDMQGCLVARSCGAMFLGDPVRKFDPLIVRPESRFNLRKYDDNLVFVDDASEGEFVVDVLVWETAKLSSFDDGMFFLVCAELARHGFGSKKEGDFRSEFFAEENKVVVGDVSMTVSNGCVVYDWRSRRDLVSKISKIFDAIGLKQFCVLRV
jgi:hypothetical protein